MDVIFEREKHSGVYLKGPFCFTNDFGTEGAYNGKIKIFEADYIIGADMVIALRHSKIKVQVINNLFTFFLFFTVE